MQAGRLNILLQNLLDMERWEWFFGGGPPHICRGRPLRPRPKKDYRSMSRGFFSTQLWAGRLVCRASRIYLATADQLPNTLEGPPSIYADYAIQTLVVSGRSLCCEHQCTIQCMSCACSRSFTLSHPPRLNPAAPIPPYSPQQSQTAKPRSTCLVRYSSLRNKPIAAARSDDVMPTAIITGTANASGIGRGLLRAFLKAGIADASLSKPVPASGWPQHPMACQTDRSF